MKRRAKRKACEERGAQLAEMAIVLVLLVILLIGVVDIGRLFYSYVAITNASREGARYGSRFPEDLDGIDQAAIQEAAAGGVVITEPDVNRSCPGGSCLGGESIVISVDYIFDTFLGGFVGLETIDLYSETEMIVFGLDPNP